MGLQPDEVLEAERQRWKVLASREHALYKQGYKIVAGVDEAGRGPLAGPVVAAACYLPPDLFLPDIDDSKKLSSAKRSDLYKKITTHKKVQWAIAIVDSVVIDEINILQAALLAMRRAISALPTMPDKVLVDGNNIQKMPAPAEAVIGGDRLCYCIAAASIIAKHSRDELMKKHHEERPEYDFENNKGYGTKKHLSALEKYGPVPDFHRYSFRPVAEAAQKFTLSLMSSK